MWFFLGLLLSTLSFAQVTILDMPAFPASNRIHASGHLEQWNFFRFTVPKEIGFVLHVEHSTKHDLDVYITNHPTTLPSPRNWVYKDNNFNPNITIEGGSEPTETTYVAGVYTFKGFNVPYIIYLTYSNGCPASCSGRGACIEGECQCNSPYAGGKCEFEVIGIQTMQEVGPWTVGEGQWQYFSFPLYMQESLQLLITLSSGTVDVYLRPQLIPTSTSYYTVQPLIAPVTDYEVDISDPALGTWYIGFYSDTNATFSFKLEEYKLCPNDCSGPIHGRCVGLYCRCNNGYFTTDCGSYRPVMMFDIPYTGSINGNSWNFYTIVGNSANAISILVDPHSSAPNCEVYIRQSLNPSLTAFDVHQTQINPSPPGSYTSLIPNPGLSEWKIGIYTSASKCNYTITATLVSTCDRCINGQCSMGVCICDTGFVGEACDRRLGVLVNGIDTTGTVMKEQWSYFTFNVVNSTQCVFILKERANTKGYLWLYLRAGAQPTLDNYLVADKNPSSSYHRISVLFASIPISFNIEVGVYGGPYIPEGSSEFNLVAYEVPF